MLAHNKKLKHKNKSIMFYLLHRFVAVMCVISISTMEDFEQSSQSRPLSGSIFVTGAVHSMGILLRATPEIVQYSEGTILKKGTIDLTDLTFTASMVGSYFSNHDYSVDDLYQEYNIDDLMFHPPSFESQQLPEASSSFLSLPKGNSPFSTLDSDTNEYEFYDQEGDGHTNPRNIMVGKTIHDETTTKPLAPFDEQSASSIHRQRRIDSGIDHDEAFVDILIFPIPKSCSRSSKNCPWVDLGIGKYVNISSTSSNLGSSIIKTEIRWCCSDEAVTLGLCARDSKEYGRLLIDSTKFVGEQRSISVPKSSTFASIQHLRDPIINVGNKKDLPRKVQEHQQQDPNSDGTNSKHLRYSESSQTYVIMFGNCLPLAQGGRDITITGTAIWKSQHGYLPIEFIRFYLFYIVLFFCTTIMVLWYSYHYYINYLQRPNDPMVIENFTLIVLLISFIEMFIRLIDYTIWNQFGSRQDSFIWCQIFVSIFKNSLTKCVVALIALGYGMSPITSSNNQGVSSIIYILTFTYVLVETTNDITLAIADKEINTLSKEESIVMIDVVTIGTSIMNLINLIFVIFIYVAYKNTIQYLHQTGAKKILQRTEQLQRICMCSAFVASISFMLNWYDQHLLANTGDNNGITSNTEEHAWIIDSMYELNYLLVIFSIAYLWKPNKHRLDLTY